MNTNRSFTSSFSHIFSMCLATLLAASAALLVSLASPASALASGDDLSATKLVTQGGDDTVSMNRLYNPNSGEHFYTASTTERDRLVKLGWNDEGVGWVAPQTSGTPVYRLYNPNAGDHFYTMSANEKDGLVAVGWNDEGIGWYSADEKGTCAALYREYNPNATTATHNFTLSVDEHVGLVDLGWRAEGAAWYGVASTTDYTGWLKVGGAWRYYQSGTMASGWLVTTKPPAFSAVGGGHQRYWLGSSGSLAISRLIDPSSATDAGAGYLAYATDRGFVARSGPLQLGDSLYIADNDGKLQADTVANRLVMMAQAYSSPSQYLIMVDIDNPRTVVLEGSQGNWKVKFVWDCCTGAPDSPTVTGVFEVGIKGYSFGEDKGYSCYYYTQFYGDYLFHTRKYYPNSRELKDGRMGERVSEGCVRLYDEDAIWIQENVPAGTTVVTTE